MKLIAQWDYVADDVMGGVSRGGMSLEPYRGRPAAVLRGEVSLDNNGGFVQLATDLRPDGGSMDARGWDGLELDLCGNGESYDIRIRTDDLTRPWQSFRMELVAPTEWQAMRVPFEGLSARLTDAVFDPSKIRRVGILAIGREFTAEIAVAGLRLYRGG